MARQVAGMHLADQTGSKQTDIDHARGFPDRPPGRGQPDVLPARVPDRCGRTDGAVI
jgi:hypothetical protein